jgi:hypothetical protein
MKIMPSGHHRDNLKCTLFICTKRLQVLEEKATSFNSENPLILKILILKGGREGEGRRKKEAVSPLRQPLF